MNTPVRVMALLVVCLIGSAFAQDPVEPGGRREVRRPLLRGLLDNVVKPIAKAADRELNPEEVDVGRLNDRFSGFFGSLIQGDNAIDQLTLRLDPEITDINNDRIGVFAHVGLRRSAWSPAPSDADLDAIITLERNQGSEPRFIVDAALRIDTDTVALAGWGFEKWRKKADGREYDDHTSNGYLALELRDYFDRLGPPRSMDEIADLFTHISGARMIGAAREVEALRLQLQDEVARADSEGRPSEGVRELEDALFASRLKRDSTYDARPRITRDREGFVREISIDIQNSSPEPGMNLEKARITFNDRRIQVSALASVTKGVQVYQLTKPLIAGALRRLQAREGDPLIEGFIRGRFPAVRDGVIGGEF